MKTEHEGTVPAETGREALVREGRAVLVSLGGRRLAREFCHRAEAALSREELAELLLEYIQSRRTR